VATDLLRQRPHRGSRLRRCHPGAARVQSPDTPRLDLAGAGLATVGLGLLVYPLVEGRQQGWPVWLVILLALSVPALAAFALLQRRTSARNGHPLIRWSLFHQRSFVAGSVLSLVFFLGVAPFFFVFSIYLQTGLGFSALATGLTVLPFAVGSGIASYRSSDIAKRLGKGVLALGAALMGLGMAFVIVTIHQTGTTVNGYELIPSLLVAGSASAWSWPPSPASSSPAWPRPTGAAARSVRTPSNGIGREPVQDRRAV
jgi:Na+/melibiose symporter-like transporter